jgi:hypothetical protein
LQCSYFKLSFWQAKKQTAIKFLRFYLPRVSRKVKKAFATERQNVHHNRQLTLLSRINGGAPDRRQVSFDGVFG